MTIRKHWIVMCDQCGDADAVDSLHVQTKRDINAFVAQKGFANTGVAIKQMQADFCSIECQAKYNRNAEAEVKNDATE